MYLQARLRVSGCTVLQPVVHSVFKKTARIACDDMFRVLRYKQKRRGFADPDCLESRCCGARGLRMQQLGLEFDHDVPTASGTIQTVFPDAPP